MALTHSSRCPLQGQCSILFRCNGTPRVLPPTTTLKAVVVIPNLTMGAHIGRPLPFAHGKHACPPQSAHWALPLNTSPLAVTFGANHTTVKSICLLPLVATQQALKR